MKHLVTFLKVTGSLMLGGFVVVGGAFGMVELVDWIYFEWGALAAIFGAVAIVAILLGMLATGLNIILGSDRPAPKKKEKIPDKDWKKLWKAGLISTKTYKKKTGRTK